MGSFVRSVVIGSGVVGAVAMAGCFADPTSAPLSPEESNADSLIVVPCPDVAGTNIDRSLAVTDPEVLSKFSFTRVMNQIRTTADVKATESSLGIFRRWMRTFGSTAQPGDCNDPSIDPNDYGLVCPRPNELELAATNPFAAGSDVKFRPVAVMNRFDLAPASGASCGEYRIVYAMDTTSPTLGGRAFIIFEASLPNPAPTKGIDGCFAVARFWQSLSADNSPASRATKLERFYFTGTAAAGGVPVVRAAHYGLSTNAGAPTLGQVRTNFFVDGRQWHLREFKLHRGCTTATDPATCQLEFAHVPVKANPAEELFGNTHPKAAAFRTAFVNQVPGLASRDLNRIRMSTANGFNEFESISQARNVDYSVFAGTQMRTAIDDKLDAMGRNLLPADITRRATTQTCAGCHEVSNGVSLGGQNDGGELFWPRSLGFVHVDERSNLSPALRTTFLPHRQRVLEKFINDRCTQGEGGAPQLPAQDETIGGGAVGAAN